MEQERLVVVNLDEIATRWQIPVARVMYLIVEHDLPPATYEKWGAQHWDVLIAEKQAAFEASVFPRHLRPEPAKSSP